MRPRVPTLLSLLLIVSCVRVRSVDDEPARSQDREARADREQQEAAAPTERPRSEVEPSAPAEQARRAIEIPDPVAKLEPQITLLSTGEEPRAPLRLRPSPGARETATLRMGMTVGMQIGSQDVAPRTIPSIEAELEAVVLEVSDGSIRYRIEALGAQAGEPGDASPRVQEAVRRAVESMRGTKGTLVVSTRGQSESIDLEIPSEGDASLRPALEGFRQSFNQMFPRLPDEPVGAGARWRAITHFVQNDIEIQQSAEYHLVAADGDRVELAFELTQRAVDTRDARELPGGSLEVESHGASGAGTVVLDLGRVLPISGDATSAGATRTRVALGGAPEPVVMALDLALSLRSP